MVKGIDIFRKYFDGYDQSYIIIGGTACDIIEQEVGQNPRATKDIDIILVVEALSPEFVTLFWKFIKDGKYEISERGNGKSEFFRFMKPQSTGFPYQIELFARKPDILNVAESSKLTPIPVDEDLSSLSAILMNDAYYNFTIEHSRILDGVRIANIESLICLKARAFIDLSARKKEGEAIDDNKIRKHFNDIFRLAVSLPGDILFNLPAELHSDLHIFCEVAGSELPDKNLFKATGVGIVEPKLVFDRLCSAFKVEIWL